jgi:tetratricopeptide (TPR) repeat protein
MVLTDANVLAFTTIEFEAFAQSNTRIIMKMLKVFSNQLRHIHRQIESLLHSEEQTNPDDGMFSVANCFYGSQQYKAASEVAVRYLRLYPAGKHVAEMKTIAQGALRTDSAFTDDGPQSMAPRKAGGPIGNDPNLALTLAEGLAGQGKWDEAYKQYHSIIEAGDSPVIGKAYVGAGQSLFQQDEYVRCVQLLSAFIGKDPKSPQMAEVLLYLGLCYQKLNQLDKAKAFFGKSLSLAGPSLAPKVKELYAACGG